MVVKINQGGAKGNASQKAAKAAVADPNRNASKRQQVIVNHLDERNKKKAVTQRLNQDIKTLKKGGDKVMIQCTKENCGDTRPFALIETTVEDQEVGNMFSFGGGSKRNGISCLCSTQHRKWRLKCHMCDQTVTSVLEDLICQAAKIKADNKTESKENQKALKKAEEEDAKAAKSGADTSKPKKATTEPKKKKSSNTKSSVDNNKSTSSKATVGKRKASGGEEEAKKKKKKIAPKSSKQTSESNQAVIKVGDTVFARPYGLAMDRYILCEVKGERTVKPSNRTDFKCKFDSTELVNLRMVKQWIPLSSVISYDWMVSSVVQGLKQSRPDMQMGDVLLNVAGSLKVDPALVIAINEQYGGIVKSSLQLSSQVDIDEDIQAEIDKGPSHEQDNRSFAVSWSWPDAEEEAADSNEIALEAPALAPPVDTYMDDAVPAVNAAETVAVRRSKRETLTNVCLKEPGIGGKLRAGYNTFVVKSLVGELTDEGWNYNQVEEALRWGNNDKEKAIARLRRKYPLKSTEEMEVVDEDESTQDMDSTVENETGVDMEVSNSDPLPLQTAPNESAQAITISFSSVDNTYQYTNAAMSIGASIVDSVEDTATATAVITSLPLKWTAKNMIANNKGILVSPQWLEQSSMAGFALPICSFRLLNGGRGNILQRVSVGITSVALSSSSPLCPPRDDLQCVISSGGGTLLSSVDAPVADGHTNRLVVTSDSPSLREKKSIEGVQSDAPITIISLTNFLGIFKTQRSPI